MLVVAAVMAVRLVRGEQHHDRRGTLDDPIITFSPTFACRCPRALKVLITATVVGLLTGFLGVGGGFLVVPALLLALALPMEYAAGTSLVVITMTSAVALVVRAGSGVSPDWWLVLVLTAASAIAAVGRRPARGPHRRPSTPARLHRPRARRRGLHRGPRLPRPRLNRSKETSMSTTHPRHAAAPEPDLGYRPGPLGRLGVAVTRHARLTTVVWLLVIVGLGAFAPRVESELSGAGWQANGSDSVTARELAQEHFGGNASTAIQVVVHSTDGPLTSPEGQQVLASATALLQEDSRIADVVQPQPGATLSEDGTTAVLMAGANADPNEMVRVADDLKGPLQDLSTSGIQVNPTGASLLWSDFNEANLSAMLKSELFSWPVTLAILVLAFGALVAAGLPLILTLAGLVASAGSLVLINQFVPGLDLGDELRDDVRARPRHRLRALRRRPLPRRPRPSREHATARDRRDHGHRRQGRPALRRDRPHLAVRGDAGALPVLPLDGRRHHALGRLRARRAPSPCCPWCSPSWTTASTSSPCPGPASSEHRSPKFAAWGERLWKRPVAFGLAALVVLLALAAPVLGLKTAMPSIKVLPEDSSARVGYDLVQDAFGDGAPGTLTIVVDQADTPDRLAQSWPTTPASPASCPPCPPATGRRTR